MSVECIEYIWSVEFAVWSAQSVECRVCSVEYGVSRCRVCKIWAVESVEGRIVLKLPKNYGTVSDPYCD